MPTISQLLKEAQITVDDLDVIASVVGPGSFTGIRIGVATANALASVGSKRVEMTSLEIELIDTTSGVALLNSKLNHFYGARKQDSSIEYFEINRSDLDRFENARYKTAFNLEKTITTFYQKYNNKIFVPQIIPFYVGKSSADK
jgi:tRNA A37 threonylcarbamoyladenosine modification protein TsaB